MEIKAECFAILLAFISPGAKRYLPLTPLSTRKLSLRNLNIVYFSYHQRTGIIYLSLLLGTTYLLGHNVRLVNNPFHPCSFSLLHASSKRSKNSRRRLSSANSGESINARITLRNCSWVTGAPSITF